MAPTRRLSILWFLMWSIAVVLVASGAQAGTETEPRVIQDALVQEIENLEVITQLNLGNLDASTVALHGESESSAPAVEQIKSHRTMRRSILSQR